MSLVLLSAMVFALPWVQDADGCGIARKRGRKVAVASESAIIIWDEQAKTEHFIRRASFISDADDFGFLVPTPTQPELAEANDDSFKHLELLFSKTPVKAKGAGKGGKGGGKAEAPKVEVLDEKRVANQHVVVLKANDVDALGKWLTDHDYEFSADLKDWVKPYIDAKWIITASKIAKDRDGLAVKNVSSTAVRMSFKTEMPFYPYRESAEQRDKSNVQLNRLLRVLFIGKTGYKGTLGERGEAWPATTTSVSIGPVSRDGLLSVLKLPQGTGAQTRQMTVFEDRSSPRPSGDDVYFSPVPANTGKGANTISEPLHSDADALIQEVLRGSL